MQKNFIFSIVILFLLVPNISFAGSQYDTDFPDVIYCHGTYYGDRYIAFKYEGIDVDNSLIGLGSGVRLYYSYFGDGIYYNSDGTFNSLGDNTVSGEDCDGFSISQLYSNNMAFDFGSGLGGGGSGTTTNYIYSSSTDAEVTATTAQIGFYSLILFFISFIVSIWMWKSFMQ